MDCSLPGSSVQGIQAGSGSGRSIKKMAGGEWGGGATARVGDLWELRVLPCVDSQEDPLKKDMAIHSSTLAWRIPWTEEPGRLQSMGSQTVGHN